MECNGYILVHCPNIIIQQVLQEVDRMKEYYQKMTFEQIISYLKKGKDLKIMTQPVTVNMPTAKYLVQSLEYYKTNYNKYKSIALKKQEKQEKSMTNSIIIQNEWMEFYDNILDNIEQGRVIKCEGKDCNKMSSLVSFYQQNLNKVNQFYKSNKVNQFYKSNNIQKHPSFWQNLQKYLNEVNARAQNYKNKFAQAQNSRKQMQQKIYQMEKKRKELQSAKNSFHSPSKLGKINSVSSSYTCELTNKQVELIKQLSELLVKPDVDYRGYKYKEAQIAKQGIPENLLSVFQQQNKKWYSVLNSLINNVDPKSSIRDIKGQTMAQKCQTLTKRINQLIKDKSVELHEKMDTGANIRNHNLVRLFSIYNTFIKKKEGELEQIIGDICKEVQKQLKMVEQQKGVKTSGKKNIPTPNQFTQRLMARMFGSNTNKTLNNSQQLKEQIQKLQSKIRDLQNQLENSKTNCTLKQSVQSQMVQKNQRLQQQLKAEIKYSAKVNKDYAELNQKYDKAVKISAEWMSQLTAVDKKQKEQEKKLVTIQKCQQFCENLLLDNYSDKQIKQLDADVVEKVFPIVSKLYQKNNLDISEDYSLDESTDKKRGLILTMLKLMKTQKQPINTKNEQAGPLKMQQKANPTLNVNRKADTSTRPAQLIVTSSLVDIKIEGKEEHAGKRKSMMEDINPLPEPGHRSSSVNNKKADKQIRQLNDEVERHKISIKTLKGRLQKYEKPPVDGQQPQDPKKSKYQSQIAPFGGENLLVLQELRNTKKSLKQTKTRENQLIQQNKGLKQQLEKLQEKQLNAENDLAEYQKTIRQMREQLNKKLESKIQAGSEKKQLQILKIGENQKNIQRADQQTQTEIAQSKQNMVKKQQKAQLDEPKLVSIPQQSKQQQKKQITCELEGKIKQLSQQLEQLKQYVSEKEKQITEKEELIRKLKQNQQLYEKDKKQLQQTFKRLNQNLQTERKKRSEGEPKQKKKEVKEMSIEYKQKLEKQITTLMVSCTNLRKGKTELTQSIQQLEEKVKTLADKQLEAKKIIEQVDKHKQEKADYQLQVKQIRANLEQLQKQKDQIQKQVSDLSAKQNGLKSLKLEYLSEQAKFDKIKKQYVEQEKIVSTWKQEVLTIEATKKQKEQEYSQLQVITSKKQSQMNQRIENIKKLTVQAQDRLKKVQEQLHQKKTQKLMYGGFSNRHFVGEVLTEQIDRQYIIDQLQKLYQSRQIVKTKLLFSFPLMRDLNPHSRVDSVPNYIIVIRSSRLTKEGRNYILALHSERPLEREGPTNNGAGFISAVSNQKTFYMKKSTANKPRIAEYNEFYFIFGNSEIKFRIDSSKLEFNVGHLYKSFDTDPYKGSEVFVGENEEVCQMLNYEIYQVLFKGDQQKQKIFK